MWAIVIEILPESHTMWELHLYEVQWWGILWTTQVNIRDDATEKFWDCVLATATICRQHLANKIAMKRLTQEQCRECNNATNFPICTELFKSADKKVHNRDHLKGEYRCSAHNACNLNYRIDLKKVKIPCIIHNLKGMLFLCYSYFHNC